MAQPTPPRVLAVLVTHDGVAWIDETLDALATQDHPAIDVIAVDNASTDGSRARLIERLGHDRVLVAERDIGFAAAVSMALDTSLAARADHVLLLHDDCALRRDALSALVAAVEDDPNLAIAGPKIVDWDDPRRLQSVGMSVDLTGRAESDLEPDELDQGQRDGLQRALYVSSAGMLVRRGVLEELGRLDRRYHLFRDDLDLCWRAWLAGYDVEVVPSAVARHVGAAANYERDGHTAFLGPRYFAERNTLATLLKNYSTPRLLVLIPAYFLVGIAKVFGFIATRRVGDAWQTVRAWGWNALHVGSTLRLRAEVQAQRLRSDQDLRPLFAQVAPRARAYAEAIVDWVAGGEPDFHELQAAPDSEPETATARAGSFVRRHPVAVVGMLFVILGVVSALPLLAPGDLRGGDLAPWPTDASALLRSYVSSWHEGSGLATADPPSPAQAVLGLLSVLAAGSAWLSSRLLVLGAIPVAWVLSLRAAAVVTPRRLPRLAAATVYALSPPALAAVYTGEIPAIALLVLLPALVIAGGTVLDPHAGSEAAWRATAGAALVAALIIAFVPVTLLVLVAVAIVAAAGTSGRSDASPRAKRGVTVRLVWVVVGAFLLLLPWSAGLIDGGPPIFPLVGQGTPGTDPFWRWLLLAPDLPGFPAPLAGAGLLACGVLGIVFGFAKRPAFVAGAWATALGAVYAAWGLDRAGESAWVWSGLPLLVAAAAFAALLALAFANVRDQLGRYAFGWRQVSSVVTASIVGVSLGVSVLHGLSDPWDAYVIEAPVLPSFIAAEEARTGPFRVLVLAEQDGTVSWDLVGPDGPSMTGYGLPTPRALTDLVGTAVDDLLSGADPGAAGRLALANVRYVVLPEVGANDELSATLADQIDLEPVPVGSGHAFLVAGWLPRAVFVPLDAAAGIERRGEVPTVEVVAFEPAGDGRYVGAAPGPGAILVSEPAANGWEATARGELLEARPSFGLMRFDVEAAADEIVVEHARQPTRTALVTLQVLGVLVALSLVLRPPRFAGGRR